MNCSFLWALRPNEDATGRLNGVICRYECKSVGLIRDSGTLALLRKSSISARYLMTRFRCCFVSGQTWSSLLTWGLGRCKRHYIANFSLIVASLFGADSRSIRNRTFPGGG